MPTDNTSNNNFANRLMNTASTESVLSLQLTNFKLQIKDVDKRVQTLENNAKEVIQKTQSSISKLVNSIFKSDTISKDETISENEIKKSLETDTDNIKKVAKNKTDECNKGICNKISVLKTTIQKSLSKTVGFFGDLIGGKYFKSNSNMLNMFFKSAKNNIKTFFSNTVGKVFDWIYSKGSIVFDLLSKLVSPITSVLKWLASGAISIIEGLYNKFISLAKIGWKVIASVWNIISEKVKSVANFFGEMLYEVISNPIGFFLLVGAFAITLKILLKPMVNFIISVGKVIWNWILDTVDKIFFQNDATKRELFFENVKNTIYGYFKSLKPILINTYNNTIGKLTGVDSKKIENWFSKDGVISKFWNDTVELFTSLVGSGILTDLKFVWFSLKDIWYKIEDKFFDDEFYAEEIQRQSNIKSENITRFDELTIQKLSDAAETHLYENLFEYYYSNLGGIKNKNEASQILTEKASTLYDNFKKNLSITSSTSKDINEKYINLLDIDLNKIVNTIVNSSQSEIKKIISEKQFETIIAAETFSALKIYYEKPDAIYEKSNIDDLHKRLNFATSGAPFQKMVIEKISNFKKEQEKIIDGKNKPVNEEALALAGRVKTLSSDYKFLAETFNFIDNTYGKIKTDLKFTLTNEKDLLNYIKSPDTNFFIETLDIFSDSIKNEKNKEKKQQLIEKALNLRIYLKAREKNSLLTETGTYNTALEEYYTNMPNKMADGGIIAKFPTNVLIAEVGDPELIVPINIDGVNFINESVVSVLNQEIYNNNNNNKEKTERESIIKRIRKQQPKPDSKIYDMKNISYGVIGVSR